MIKAVDNAGNESKNFAYCLYNFGDVLAENVLVNQDIAENNWEKLTKPLQGCEIKNGEIVPLSQRFHWNKKAKHGAGARIIGKETGRATV